MQHASLTTYTGIAVYFADPYSSWQRGTNENMNGRLRRYIPKKTDFSTFTDTDLDDMVAEINNHPRKCLGYIKPVEAFYKELAQIGALPLRM